MNKLQIVGLREFNRITKTQQIQIPEDIETVTQNLNALGGLLTASEWARSAVVRAWVSNKHVKCSNIGENSPISTIFTISDFAKIGIQGLSSRSAVRHYYNAWDLTKLPNPQRGEIVDLPQIPFPLWDIPSKNLALLHTGDQENYTPAEIILMVKEVLGNIDLDPASTEFAQKTVQAKEYFTEDDNGLSKPWYGNVFLNPPYQMPKIKQFINKLIDELPNLTAAILLTNNNTDTIWFYNSAKNSKLICFTKGRINFYKTDEEKTYPTNGQTFFYFGEDENKFTEIFSQVGLIMRVER